MFKIALLMCFLRRETRRTHIAPCVILASLVIATPAFASDPMCQSVIDRTVQFRQLHLDRYNDLVKSANSGGASNRQQEEMVAREKIVDEAYDWLKLLSYSNVNGYTSNCVEIHFKLKRMGY